MTETDGSARARWRRSPVAAMAGAASLALLLAGGAMSESPVYAGTAAGSSGAEPAGTTQTGQQGFYSTKKPYEQLGGPEDYEQPPAGFEPVFVQHVARHGSRLLSSRKYDDLTLQLWEAARGEQALTPLGARLGGEVRRLMRLHERLGYGNLSELGAQEHEEMAQRVYERLPGLFEHALDHGDRIGIVTSGKDRAVDSGVNFADGLVKADPALAEIIDEPVADEDVLYFHKSDANQDYQDYKDNDPRLLAVLDEVAAEPQIHAAARRMLERLYTVEFVDRLEAGEFDFVDGGKGETHLNDIASAADYLYNLYIIAPNIAAEGNWRFDQYVTREDAETMAYFADAQQFYEKGPAFAGDDITYRMADVLLDDFFASIEDRTSGDGDHAAVFRFAHAEQIMPFAALIELPGSTQEMPEGELFTYENNPWRGDQVSPMGANIQWDVFADADGEHLVRMLYNEEEVAFRVGCEPYTDGSAFYDVAELKRCLGDDR
ncbi:histidine-type phosphatase [Phytoactinopolyspora mesophila]|uniref:Multiple inositol polyphosphate phosphatase 1 n=1 Tax=Phytoactinopolyspora mesophila TaxID=2650750 RepID=A0A7K3M712_9ACTN|nr:histidine-type phosphatase [Phytoactinopolyspora mesophila]NDL58712.1 histidine-type phosphatase [Phytoactinopolyspora mesophila]